MKAFVLLLPVVLACGSAPKSASFPTTTTTTTSASSNEMLLVLAKRDQTLAVVDSVTLKVVLKLPTGPDPHEVVTSADGRYAYVSNYGGGSFNTLAVLDLVAKKALPSIDLGALRGPHGLTINGGKVWFTAEGAKAVARFDPATQKVDSIIGTGQDRTHMLFVGADEKRIVTTNVSSGTVSILDMVEGHRGPPGGGPGGPPPGGGPGGAPPGGGPGGPPPGGGPGGPPPGGGPGGPPPPRSDWEQTVVAVGHGPEGFDVSPDGKEVWVANAHDGTVSIVDPTTKTVTATLDVGVRSANRLKFTIDGARVLVSELGGHDLVVIDAHTRQVVKRIAMGRGAAGIQIQPDGRRAFVACSPDNRVAVVDLQKLEVAGQIDAGEEPDGLAWAVRR